MFTYLLMLVHNSVCWQIHFSWRNYKKIYLDGFSILKHFPKITKISCSIFVLSSCSLVAWEINSGSTHQRKLRDAQKVIDTFSHQEMGRFYISSWIPILPESCCSLVLSLSILHDLIDIIPQHCLSVTTSLSSCNFMCVSGGQ